MTAPPAPRTGTTIMSHGDTYYTGSNMPNDAWHQGAKSAHCYNYPSRTS